MAVFFKMAVDRCFGPTCHMFPRELRFTKMFPLPGTIVSGGISNINSVAAVTLEFIDEMGPKVLRDSVFET